MAFSLLPREDDYFLFFSQMTEQIKLAANELNQMFAGEPSSFADHVARMKEIEHTCDDINRNIVTKLSESFVTPFDREDIYQLTVALDNVCDYINIAARTVLMYRIEKINQRAAQFGQMIQVLSDELHAATAMLRKHNGIAAHFVNIHRLETQADELYFQSVSELFNSETDAVRLVQWKELYEVLENTVDRYESAANIIESVILKHT